MLFSWLKNRRRKKLLAQPFPDAWHLILKRNVQYYAELNKREQAKLCDDLRVIVAEKTWTGIGDLKVNNEMKVTVSGQACLLLLNIEHDYFACTREIILHPAEYKSLDTHTFGGLVESDAPGLLGQAYYRGPVVLSWASALAGGRDDDDGRNVVLHEFAHKLDMADDLSDGTPPLENHGQYRQWVSVMSDAFNQLRDHANRGRATLLDKYGATNEAEFFACATECFFEKPVQLKKKHSNLYDVLEGYYQQDPARRNQR